MNQKKQHENEIAENDLVSYLEDKIGHLKPYWSHITLGICILFLGAIAIAFMMQQAQANEAAKWQLLSVAQDNYRLTLDNTSLSDFAEQYNDDVAGLWALLFAADAEIRSGLTDLSSDRKAGFDKIKKAQEMYREVVDSTIKKSTMLQRRSVHGLAYALESSGDFEEAKSLYEGLLGDKDEDSDTYTELPFAEFAERGIERCSNPEYAALLVKFREFELIAGDAPGPSLPDRPNINFAEPEGEQPNSGGGDFGSDDSADSNDDSASSSGEGSDEDNASEDDGASAEDNDDSSTSEGDDSDSSN